MTAVEYDRAAAIAYAERWALDRNPDYFSFNGIGGDCTNFVSQCVYAGCGVMNWTPVTGWFYIDANDRSASWTSVMYFYRFMTTNTGTGPYAVQTGRSGILPGDVLQLGQGGEFYHTLFVLEKTPDEIYIAAHSNDALYRPLSSYSYGQIRYLHIAGARK